jgi:hypothetical protein
MIHVIERKVKDKWCPVFAGGDGRTVQATLRAYKMQFPKQTFRKVNYERVRT